MAIHRVGEENNMVAGGIVCLLSTVTAVLQGLHILPESWPADGPRSSLTHSLSLTLLSLIDRHFPNDLTSD